MTRKNKCHPKSPNSFVAAAEQVCRQPVLDHRQPPGRRHRCCRAPAPASDRDLLPAGRAATNPPHAAAAAVDGEDRQTEGRTDARPFRRPCCAYYAGSVNKSTVERPLLTVSGETHLASLRPFSTLVYLSDAEFLDLHNVKCIGLRSVNLFQHEYERRNG